MEIKKNNTYVIFMKETESRICNISDKNKGYFLLFHIQVEKIGLYASQEWLTQNIGSQVQL